MAKKPDTSVHVQPSVRTGAIWSPALIRAAEAQADRGNFALAAQLCDALLGDDRISGVLNTRVAALLGAKPTFEPGKGRDTTEEVAEDWWTMFPEEELGELVKWRILLGVGLAQLPWSGGTRWFPELDIWHPSFLRHDAEKREWQIDLGKGPPLPIEPGQGAWLLYTAGKSRPWSRGQYRALARWYLLKSYAIDDWSRHSEIAAKGVITSPVGTTREIRRELAQDLSEMGREGQIALPPGFDYKLIELSANTRDIYLAQIEVADKAIAINLLGNNLTTEVQGGSLAATNAHAGVSFMHTRSDGETLSTCLHNQALKPWAEYNFGSRDAAPWAKWPTEAPEDLTAKATMYASLSTALPMLSAMGADERAILESFDIPLREAGKSAPALPAWPAQPQNARPSVRLASGAFVAKDDPFVQGQDYADGVIEKAMAHAVKSPALASLVAIVQSAKSYDDVERKVAEAFLNAPPEELASLIERALIMADLAGRYAARQEAP